HKRALLQPDYGFRTNVYAYAKRDLRKGVKLDGIGGYHCYGLIENCTSDGGQAGLPVCLAENVTLKGDVRQDEKIFLHDVSFDPERFDFALYGKAVKLSRHAAA